MFKDVFQLEMIEVFLLSHFFCFLSLQGLQFDELRLAAGALGVDASTCCKEDQKVKVLLLAGLEDMELSPDIHVLLFPVLSILKSATVKLV